MKKKLVKQTPAYIIIPLFLLAAIVPMIVRLKLIPIDDISFKYWIGDKQNNDFFSYYKAIFTIILASASLLMFVFARYKKILETRQLIIYYIPIAVYAVTIVLSTLLSKYPLTAQNGFVDRYEGVYVLLAYLAILFTTINLANNEKLIKIMVLGLFISAFGVCSIGIFQFFGMDLFQSEFIKEFILPIEYRSLKLAFTFGAHTIYSTMYNTNFVGSYMAMLLPLAFAAFLYSKRMSYKIASGAFTCLMFANWLGCRSRAGYIGGAIAMAILLIITIKLIIRNIKSVIPLLAAFIIIFIGMNYAADGELGGRIFTSLANIGKYTVKEKEATNTALLNDIVFSDKKVSIVYGKNTLNMAVEGTQLVFTDTNGKTLVIKNDSQGNITFEDARYLPYNIAFNKDDNTFDFEIDYMRFLLYADQSGFKIVGERSILLDKIDHPEKFGFDGKEKFASMRGYIWSRSIPLLKNNIIVGGGPDTYAMQFPQHDYVGKLRAFNMIHEIVDKPHDMYLQIGINTGVLSLIAVLFLFAAYILSSFKLLFKNGRLGEQDLIGSAFLVAVLGYVIAALANDSLVSVAPVFWVILGLGISYNYLFTRLHNGEGDILIKQGVMQAGSKTYAKGASQKQRK